MIRILLSILLFIPSIASASDWTLPSDFAENTTAYPLADSLPVVTTPGALTTAARIQMGGAYHLANDIYARADGFAIEADNVSIDLRGHKIVYAGEALNRSYGIAIPAHYERLDYFPRGYVEPGGATNTTITDTVGGGKIVKATNMAIGCSGIFGYTLSSGLTVSNIEINHSGIDASGIELMYFYGAVSITGVTTNYDYVRDSVPIIDPAVLAHAPDNISTFYWVSNRHSGYVAGIKIANGNHTSLDISGNSINNSPQMGIYISDNVHMTPPSGARDAAFFDNPSAYAFKNRVSNNTVTMNAKATNCYGLTLSSDKTHAWGNVVSGYGAGIGLGSFYGYAHDNVVTVTQGANPEYPERLWAH